MKFPISIWQRQRQQSHFSEEVVWFSIAHSLVPTDHQPRPLYVAHSSLSAPPKQPILALSRRDQNLGQLE